MAQLGQVAIESLFNLILTKAREGDAEGIAIGPVEDEESPCYPVRLVFADREPELLLTTPPAMAGGLQELVGAYGGRPLTSHDDRDVSFSAETILRFAPPVLGEPGSEPEPSPPPPAWYKAFEDDPDYQAIFTFVYEADRFAERVKAVFDAAPENRAERIRELVNEMRGQGLHPDAVRGAMLLAREDVREAFAENCGF
jgi:hypothetical protein